MPSCTSLCNLLMHVALAGTSSLCKLHTHVNNHCRLRTLGYFFLVHALHAHECEHATLRFVCRAFILFDKTFVRYVSALNNLSASECLINSFGRIRFRPIWKACSCNLDLLDCAGGIFDMDVHLILELCLCTPNCWSWLWMRHDGKFCADDGVGRKEASRMDGRSDPSCNSSFHAIYVTPGTPMFFVPNSEA